MNWNEKIVIKIYWIVSSSLHFYKLKYFLRKFTLCFYSKASGVKWARKNSVTFSISCRHAKPDVEGKKRIKWMEISPLCWFLHFFTSIGHKREAIFYVSHFRTIKFVINASRDLDSSDFSNVCSLFCYRC